MTSLIKLIKAKKEMLTHSVKAFYISKKAENITRKYLVLQFCWLVGDYTIIIHIFFPHRIEKRKDW